MTQARGNMSQQRAFNINCNIDITTPMGCMTLTYEQMKRVYFSIPYIQMGYNYLTAYPWRNDDDQLDIPHPSHIYADYVVNLGENCFFFTVHHNNSRVPYVCLFKNGQTVCLSKDFFDVDFKRLLDPL